MLRDFFNRTGQNIAEYEVCGLLALQNKVSKGLHLDLWMRKWGAKPRSMGYLLDNIHSRIERRPDTLESILFDAEARSCQGQHWLDLWSVR